MTTCLLAQLNLSVGRIDENAHKILSCLQKVHNEKSAELVIFPELALSGYPPEDLLLRDDFLEHIQQSLNHIIDHTPKGIVAIVGYPELDNKKLYNSAAVILNKKIIANYHKQCLPNYGVFDEKRYFKEGDHPTVFELNDTKFGLVICEDMWHKGPAEAAKAAGAEALIVINASPFYTNKYAKRLEKMRDRLADIQIPLLYVHHVNGQDDLIFDGGSFVLDQKGELCAQAKFFEEDLLAVDLNKLKKINPKIPNDTEQNYKALVFGTQEYVLKNNFKKVIVGVSGGIDSALTLAIAVDALGKENVSALILPTQFTSQLSLDLAQKQINQLGIKQYKTINIEPLYQNYLSTFGFDSKKNNLTTQNIQARIRGNILMAVANEENRMLLNTSNKSEMAQGYGTLYGDMCGSYAVLKDVWKTEAFKLAQYRNLVPEIISRPPTAELAPHQLDSHDLPPYEILDPILKNYIEHDLSIAEIVKLGFDKDTVKKVVHRVKLSEYKRRQFVLGPRITRRAFTRERRYPITTG